MRWSSKNLLLRTQLVLCSMIAVGAAVAVMTMLSISMFRAEMQASVAADQEKHLRIFWDLLRQKGTEFHLDGEQLMVGSYVLNGETEILSRLDTLCGGVASIVRGDERVATSVLMENGKRAVGTKVQADVKESLLLGKAFRGETNLLGKTYLTAYDPIRDENGKVIGALVVGVDKDHYFASVHRMERSIAMLAVLTIAFFALCTWVFARYAFAPLAQAAKAATEVASGDLSCEIESRRGDETGIVLESLQRMIISLRTLIGQVRSSSIQLTSAANQIGAIAKVQRVRVNELVESCEQATGSAQEIAAIGEHVLETMSRLAEYLEEAVESANTGHKHLGEMDEAMRDVISGAEIVSARLSDIDERTAKINQAVIVMTKVADQTNLLSLNAAIEAKKAGEAGKGFTVLAEEISRLADQSAAGTLEIEQMAMDVKNSVASGVHEMERYGQKVERGVQASADANLQLMRIIRLVQQLKPQFLNVSDSMRAQYASGQQVMASIRQLNEGAQATSASIQGVQDAAEHLNDAVKGLRTEVGRFKLNS